MQLHTCTPDIFQCAVSKSGSYHLGSPIRSSQYLSWESRAKSTLQIRKLRLRVLWLSKQLKNPELEMPLLIADACPPALQRLLLPCLESATCSVVTACCPLGSQIVLIWGFYVTHRKAMKIMQCHSLEGPGPTDQVYDPSRRENTVTPRDRKGRTTSASLSFIA